jgi:hypothetical protein
MRATYLARLILLDVITRMIFDVEDKLLVIQ